MTRPLPRPVTVTDKYLEAILAELQERPSGKPITGIAELQEPKAQRAPTTMLPKSFPGYDALKKAGFSTYEGIPQSGDYLVKIKGIGKSTAGQILAALA